MANDTKLRLARISELSSLVIAAAIPLLFVLPIEKTIDQQAYSLLIAGLLAWISLILKPKLIEGYFNRPIMISLGLFFSLSCVSAILNNNLGYTLFGAPLVRIGILSYLAIFGIALVIARQKFETLIKAIYLLIIVAAILSFPLSLIAINSVDRVGGIYYQPDILGVVVGCGILLGLQIFRQQLFDNRIMYISMAYLVALLFATQARAPIFITLMLAVVWLATNATSRYGINFWGSLLGVGFIVGLFSFYFMPRLTNIEFAQSSANYRIDLAKEGLKSVQQRPIIGYGPGNLADALDCQKLRAEELVITCSKDYFFNSSHIIFLDKFLTTGVVGGLSYLSAVLLAIYWGLRLMPSYRILAYCVGLIGLYYFTNVTSLVVEMLLLILIIWIARQKPASRA